MNSLISKILCVVFLSCSSSIDADEMEIISGRAMGTSYTLKLGRQSETTSLQEASTLVKNELERIEAIFSLYRTESELSRWNAALEGEWLEVSDDLYTVTEFAIELSRQTHGAFDPTIRPLMELWQLNSLSAAWQPPTTEAIQETKKNIGVNQIELRSAPYAILKRNGMVKLDLNALIEGWAIDRVRSLLQVRRYHNFLFELGGEFGAVGKPNQASMWRVGIENPRNPDRLISKVVLNGEALCTSGSTKQGRVYRETRYSHILDPRTGSPINHSLAAVSVLHSKAMFADGWSTALMVLGPQEGMLMAEQKGLTASFIRATPKASQINSTTVAVDRFKPAMVEVNPSGWIFKVLFGLICVLLLGLVALFGCKFLLVFEPQ